MLRLTMSALLLYDCIMPNVLESFLDEITLEREDVL
jgi:hypothetical protein